MKKETERIIGTVNPVCHNCGYKFKDIVHSATNEDGNYTYRKCKECGTNCKVKVNVKVTYTTEDVNTGRIDVFSKYAVVVYKCHPSYDHKPTFVFEYNVTPTEGISLIRQGTFTKVYIDVFRAYTRKEWKKKLEGIPEIDTDCKPIDKIDYMIDQWLKDEEHE